MSSPGGKGSIRRPSQISEAEEQAKWDLIFRKKPVATENELLKDDEMGFNEPKENE
jgi:hypothetical protein